MVRSIFSFWGKAQQRGISVTPMATFCSAGSSAMPALPEPQKRFQPAETAPLSTPDACSRPPFTNNIILSFSARELMTEVTHIGEDHRNAMFVSSGNDFVVTG